MANATMGTNLGVERTDRPTSAGRTARAPGQVTGGWGADARRLVRKHPAAVLIGAFIIGVALAKAARHA